MDAAASEQPADGRLTVVLDFAIWPLAVLWTVGSTYALLALSVPAWAVAGAVIAPLAVAAAIAERVRPEREDHRPLDQPLRVEVLHYIFDYNLGYGLAALAYTGVGIAVERVSSVSLWPKTWPLALQVALAATLGEAVSYWQHRLIHRVKWAWPFHALHHRGERLNLVRTARFHFVDIGPAIFLVYLPLVLLRAPDAVLLYVATISGSFGILQHANIRMRTHWLADAIFCTPAVHRFHHSIDRREGDSNFGTTVMIFDRLFGTFSAPTAPGPRAIGVAGEVLPGGFLAQIAAPFRTLSAARPVEASGA